MPRTTEQLLNLDGVNTRSSWFRFDVLDRTLTKIGEVKPDSNPKISNDTSRTILRTMSDFTLPANVGEDFNEISTRIKAVMVLENGVENSLGIFPFITASRTANGYGVVFDGTLVDQGILVDQKSKQSFGVQTGHNIDNAITQILEQQNIHLYRIDSSFSTVGASIAWPAGTSWLRIINELSALKGCLPLFFTADGVARIKLNPNVSADYPSVSYKDGLNIFETGIRNSNSILTAPNTFVVIESGANNYQISAEFSLSPSAPNSFDRTGLEIVQVINEQGLESYAAALARARLASTIDGVVYETAIFDGPPDWRHESYDVIELQEERWLEQKWDLTCEEGSPMNHTVRKVYSDAA